MRTSNYEEIALEYYDSRHITSRNFDTATFSFFQTWQSLIPAQGAVLDLGAGRGVVNFYCGVECTRIIQSDISHSMLTLSHREECKARIQSDALVLPFAQNTFTAVAAFLFDPYNRPSLYPEINRVLMDGGLFLGTLPHYNWGTALRRIRGYSRNKARLIKRNGDVVERDSFLMNDEEIEKNLKDAQLQLIQSHDLCLPRIQREVSPDIIAPAEAAGISPYELPIVKLVIARKG